MYKLNLKKSRKYFSIILFIVFLLYISYALQAKNINSNPSEKETLKWLTSDLKTIIPFERDKDTEMLVLNSKINDKGPFRLLIDTGCGVSALSPEIVKQLNLKETVLAKKVTVMDGSGKQQEIKLYLAEKIQLSDVTIKDVLIAEIPIKNIQDKMKIPIDGMLGWADCLDQVIIHINWDKNQLILYDPEKYRNIVEDNPKSIPLVIPIFDKTVRLMVSPYIPMVIGTKKGLFSIDIGSELQLSITNQEMMTEIKHFGYSGEVTSLLGKTKIDFGFLESIIIGEYEIRDIIVDFGKKIISKEDGIIGRGILRKFNITIDYSRYKILLEPNKHSNETRKEDSKKYGFFFIKQERYEEAEKCLRLAIQYNPNDEEVKYLLANTLGKQEKYQEALEYLKQLSSSSYWKENPAYIFNLGETLLGLGHPKKSIPYLETAVKKSPEYVQTWYTLGLAYAHEGKWEKAKGYLEKAVELDPKHVYAYGNLGSAYDHLGNSIRAIKCYEKSLQLKPIIKVLEYLLAVNVKVYGDKKGKERTKTFIEQLPKESQIFIYKAILKNKQR